MHDGQRQTSVWGLGFLHAWQKGAREARRWLECWFARLFPGHCPEEMHEMHCPCTVRVANSGYVSEPGR